MKYLPGCTFPEWRGGTHVVRCDAPKHLTRAYVYRSVLFVFFLPSLHLQIPYRMKPNKSQLGKFVSGRQVSIFLETSYYYLRELIQVMDNETKDTRRHARALFK